MIVVDASSLLELLLQSSLADKLADRLLRPRESLHAPHLVDVEMLQVLRRLSLSSLLSDGRARQVLADLESLAIERHSHVDLLSRIWQLRASVTAYDAAYVALAEALDAPLITCDAKLAHAHGHGAIIELVG